MAERRGGTKKSEEEKVVRRRHTAFYAAVDPAKLARQAAEDARLVLLVNDPLVEVRLDGSVLSAALAGEELFEANLNASLNAFEFPPEPQVIDAAIAEKSIKPVCAVDQDAGTVSKGFRLKTGEFFLAGGVIVPQYEHVQDAFMSEFGSDLDSGLPFFVEEGEFV